ncbi:zinc ribbon domain-containing protein [Thermodesulfobacteriota bacterium]
MKKHIENLVKLQHVETESRKIAAKLNDVSQRFEALDAGLSEFERTMEEEEKQISEMKKKYREHESDVEMNISRIKKSQAKLSAVKENREYQAILKEIEDLKAMNSRIEDEMLESLEFTEGAEDAVSAKQVELSRLSEHVKKEKENIRKETEQGKKMLAQLETECQEYYRIIDADLLKKFMKIKEQHGGKIAIVPVKSAVCQGCNMNIPPQMYNELYSGDALKFCPNCQRIIYVEKSVSDT